MMPQTRKEDPGGEGGNSTGTCSIDLVVSIMPQTREEDPGGEGGHHQQGQQGPCTQHPEKCHVFNSTGERREAKEKLATSNSQC